MKKYLLMLMVLALTAVSATAQHKGKFDPNKFKADLHAYIVKEVQLTEAEQARFFPVWDEMMDKQRDIFLTLKQLRHQKNMTDVQAKQNILRCDLLESQLKQIERNYHLRMLKVLPATKLFYVFKAERQFRRQTLRNFCTTKENGKRKKQ